MEPDQIAAATVRFPRKEKGQVIVWGQGVVVPGNLIVTAAHVLRWKSFCRESAFDHHHEVVEVAGRRLMVEVFAAEPISDIAVLGCPDDQAFFEEAEAFEEVVESIEPVPICTADFPWMTPFPVSIRTHTGRWVDGQARQCHVNASALAVEASEGIIGGTSGGPVVTTDGVLLGVVSTSGGSRGEAARSVSLPRLHQCVPGWLLRKMLDPEWEHRAMREQVEHPVCGGVR